MIEANCLAPIRAECPNPPAFGMLKRPTTRSSDHQPSVWTHNRNDKPLTQEKMPDIVSMWTQTS